MSNDSAISNKFFQEFTLVNSKDWNTMQEENERQVQSGGLVKGQLDEDLAAIKHPQRANIVYYANQIRKIHALIMALAEGRLKKEDLPYGVTMEGLIKRKQKLLQKHGNRIMNLGVTPAAFAHQKEMQRLTTAGNADARRTARNTGNTYLQTREALTAANNILNVNEDILQTARENEMNTREMAGLMYNGGKDKYEGDPNDYDGDGYGGSSDDDDGGDGGGSGRKSKETYTDRSFLDRINAELPEKYKLSPKGKAATFDDTDGKHTVQKPGTSTHKMQLRSKGEGKGKGPKGKVLKGNGIMTVQNGSGVNKNKMQKITLFLPPDCDAYISRPMFKKPWKAVR